MSGFFTVILLASLAGVLFPFWGMRRRHFALTAFGAFIGVGAFAPAPTPQEIAAKEAEKAREAAEKAKIAAKERAEEERELAEARRASTTGLSKRPGSRSRCRRTIREASTGRPTAGWGRRPLPG